VTVLFTCKVNNFHHLALKKVYLYRRLLMFTLLKFGFLIRLHTRVIFIPCVALWALINLTFG